MAFSGDTVPRDKQRNVRTQNNFERINTKPKEQNSLTVKNVFSSNY
jgi:hypothetical protein